MAIPLKDQAFWEGEKLFLFPYYPKESPQRNAQTELVWQFKGEETSALYTITTLAVQAFAHAEQWFTTRRTCWYLLALPPHKAGRPNAPCEILCARLAMHYRWLIHLPSALVRLEDVPKSSTADKKGQRRPDYWRHVETISYEGPCQQEQAEGGIILVDDVFTTGGLFQACYSHVKDATRCDCITGFFVGKSM